MSFEALRWAQRVRTGSAPRKSLLIMLAQFSDEADSCFPSQATLAELTELGERTVRRELAALERMRLIRRAPRYEKGRRTSDRFFLQVSDGLPPSKESNDGRPDSDRSEDRGEGGENLPASVAGGEQAYRPDSAKPTGQCGRVTPRVTPRTAADDVRAQGADLHEVGREVLRRMGVLEDPKWLGSYARVQAWLASGADPELDIYPTIERLMARRGGNAPQSLRYFDQAIADALAERQRPLPNGARRHGQTTRQSQPGSAAEDARLRAGIAEGYAAGLAS